VSYLLVVPVIVEETAVAFAEGLKIPHENVLVVDNGVPPVLPEWDGPYHHEGQNIGVSAAWNIGARMVLGKQRDWLIIASSALKWGEPGGADFVAELDRCAIAVTSEHGWHLCALNRTTLETVGLFDENFFAYYEDTDYLYRMHLAGLPSPRENNRHWDHAHCDAEYGENAHALARVEGLAASIQMNELDYYYRRKWGAKSSFEYHKNPFGLDNYPISRWPAVERPEPSAS